jgi:hypothetical protein
MSGYIYCFSNESMPNIFKIGMTERTPDERLKEANMSDTWRPPTPYKLEFAKKVNDVKNKETILHKLLEKYTQRINPKREFFRVSIEEVQTFFELMDGEMYSEIIESPKTKESKILGCRDMKKCFKDKQRIRHVIDEEKIWIGYYDSESNTIIQNEIKYKSLSSFTQTHYSIDRPDRCKESNGWAECECEIEENKWISTYSLSEN